MGWQLLFPPLGELRVQTMGSNYGFQDGVPTSVLPGRVRRQPAAGFTVSLRSAMFTG